MRRPVPTTLAPVEYVTSLISALNSKVSPAGMRSATSSQVLLPM